MSNTTCKGTSPGRRRLARGIAGALLVALLSPMTLSLAGCTMLGLVAAVATKPRPRVIPAGDALHLEPGTRLRIALPDGQQVAGRYAGRTLLPPAAYAPRFARRSSARRMPIVPGDSVVVTQVDGRVVSGGFRGYAVRSLVLRTSGTSDVRIPFDAAREIRREGGGLVSIDSLRAADERDELPSLEALAIETLSKAWSKRLRTETAVQVPFEDIRGATVRTDKGIRTGFILLGLAVDVAIIAIVAASYEGLGGSGCSSSGFTLSHAVPSERWTMRPFDRQLARFIDEWDAAPGLASVPFDRTWVPDTTASPPAHDVRAFPPASPSAE